MNADGWTFTLSENGESVRADRNGEYMGTWPWETLRRFVMEQRADRLEKYMQAEEQAGKRP